MYNFVCIKRQFYVYFYKYSTPPNDRYVLNKNLSKRFRKLVIFII